ncbi:hypothetical protein Clacol_000370 [Clathrus columnatus]|uniref:Uncharacterized protein n=1 Tax=Clathrus columnatus TaxID=1419009 RepID=A0AAV4ZWF7_9AGAM|nr:hypothetical protein Clacol_000370 [Clathrus columnatus]
MLGVRAVEGIPVGPTGAVVNATVHYVLCMECNQRDEKRKPWLYKRRPKPQKVYEDSPNTDYDTALLWGEVAMTRDSVRDSDSEEENGVPQEVASLEETQNGELTEESQDLEEDDKPEDATTEYTESDGYVEGDQPSNEDEDEEKNIHHHWSHDLVLCTNPQAPLPVVTLDDKVEQVGKSVASLESRLVRMEELLQRLVTQLHPKP